MKRIIGIAQSSGKCGKRLVVTAVGRRPKKKHLNKQFEQLRRFGGRPERRNEFHRERDAIVELARPNVANDRRHVRCHVLCEKIAFAFDNVKLTRVRTAAKIDRIEAR